MSLDACSVIFGHARLKVGLLSIIFSRAVQTATIDTGAYYRDCISSKLNPCDKCTHDVHCPATHPSCLPSTKRCEKVGEQLCPATNVTCDPPCIEEQDLAACSRCLGGEFPGKWIQQDACKAGVRARLTIDMEYSEVSQNIPGFTADFRDSVSAACQIDKGRIWVNSIVEGSITLEFSLFEEPRGTKTARAAMADVEAQIADSSSALRTGSFGKYAEKASLKVIADGVVDGITASEIGTTTAAPEKPWDWEWEWPDTPTLVGGIVALVVLLIVLIAICCRKPKPKPKPKIGKETGKENAPAPNPASNSPAPVQGSPGGKQPTASIPMSQQKTATSAGEVHMTADKTDAEKLGLTPPAPPAPPKEESFWQVCCGNGHVVPQQQGAAPTRS